IGVWVGNADGEGRPGITGIKAAAPILFEIFKLLPTKKLWFDTPYDDLTTVKVCQKSGFLASKNCDKILEQLVPVNAKNVLSCPYHEVVFLDKTEQFRVNTSCYLPHEMLEKKWFKLPPLMEYYYALANPQYENFPPLHPTCMENQGAVMQFIYPKKNQQILLPKDFDEQRNELILKLVHQENKAQIFWYLNEDYLGKTETFHEMAILPRPGKHQLSVMDQYGNMLKIPIEIIALE
ncbi:MAG: penicillin-binding protein 1C, partial [Flavobacteriaceae bacterium]|nr:penicillin-binding protein 1C [Flavobacteriaceae bacterium]